MAGCCDTPARNLLIETTVIRVHGKTSGRCTDTVESTRIAARELEETLAPLNVTVTLIEHDAVSDDLSDSNSVTINGRSVEEWLGAERVLTECGPCSELTGENVRCGAISIEGSVAESYSVEDIREAAFTALNEGCGGGCC
jgi:hypothetical protein